jgi:hypothetical protein
VGDGPDPPSRDVDIPGSASSDQVSKVDSRWRQSQGQQRRVTPTRLLTGLLTLLEARFCDGKEERALEIVLPAMRADGLFLAIDLCSWQDVAPDLLGSLYSHISHGIGSDRVGQSRLLDRRLEKRLERRKGKGKAVMNAHTSITRSPSLHSPFLTVVRRRAPGRIDLDDRLPPLLLRCGGRRRGSTCWHPCSSVAFPHRASSGSTIAAHIWRCARSPASARREALGCRPAEYRPGVRELRSAPASACAEMG